MKNIATVAILGLALVLAGCGNNNNNAMNGHWTAALTGSQVLSLSFTLNSTSDNNISVSNLNFTTQSPCFAGGATAVGAFTVSGTLNGVTSGGYQMTITSNTGDNKLVLTGTLKNNTVTGSWILSGSTSGCTGSGNFTMNKS
jgi:hypothetical protein